MQGHRERAYPADTCATEDQAARRAAQHGGTSLHFVRCSESVDEPRPDELVERGAVTGRDDGRNDRLNGLAEQRQASERLARPDDLPTVRSQHAADDDGKAALLVLRLVDRVARLQLTALHATGKPLEGVARQPGEHLDPGKLPDGRELMAHSRLDPMEAGNLRDDRRVDAAIAVFEVQLVTRDLDRMSSFYRHALGLKVSVEDRERGRMHFRLGRGQLILALSGGEDASPDWHGLPPPLLAASDRRGPAPPLHGPIHFALEVPASELVRRGEQLRAEGLDVRGPFRWPGGQRSIYVQDPEGNVAELIAG
jgi:catechol 2,3-dioxygenase-like lactoylglutathione lyase family enzyme